MVAMLLGSEIKGAADKSDALAVAICHAHSGGFLSKLKELDPGPRRRRSNPRGSK
jgi:Holliday junction resolvasome RuvABC endonuclease subunit